MMGDFTGFSFDHIHSSELGIVRVSDGNRYDESLLPEFEDLVSDVRGIDGQYYFGHQYQPKHFEISIAFDHMTEHQFRQLRRLLSIKTPSPLIFDERPYKQYTAKIESVPELSYICFLEPRKVVVGTAEGDERYGVRRDINTRELERIYPYEIETDLHNEVVYERIYKGEGTINFICYYPFARAQFKILDLYGDFNFQSVEDFHYRENNPRPIKKIDGSWDWSQMDENLDYIDYGNPLTIYTNVNEWAESSYIMPYSVYLENNIDKIVPASINQSIYNYMIPVYNPGDIDAPFNLFIPYTASDDNDNGVISPKTGQEYIIIDAGTYQNVLILKPIISKKAYKDENGIMINTRNHLIEGVKYDKQQEKWETTGELYNEFIVRGDFGKIDRSAFYPFSMLTQAIYLNIADANATDIKIHYNYLYY